MKNSKAVTKSHEQILLNEFLSESEKMYKITITSEKREHLSFCADILSVYGILTGIFGSDGIACNLLNKIIQSKNGNSYMEFI